MTKDLRKMYRVIERDIFPGRMTISFSECTTLDGKPYGVHKTCEVIYEKVTWNIKGEEKGLRYGDNPGQSCALFKPINGNFVFGEVECIKSGKYLVSETELLQSGKHPGKTNITDADNALNIMKYFDDPTVVIMKHNNPCGAATFDVDLGVASRNTLERAYHEANMADRVAAFGGAIALNRPVDKATAEAIAANYSEVVVAPEYEQGVIDILSKRRNLRIMRIKNIARLKQWKDEMHINFKSLEDGGVIVETSYKPRVRTIEDLKALGVPIDVKEYELNEETRKMVHTGRDATIVRTPTEAEYKDMLFGWLVESGITSNSVIYVKNLATIGIGTGEQDRVGVAEIARDKAYTKLRDRLCFENNGIAYNVLELQIEQATTLKETTDLKMKKEEIDDAVSFQSGGLEEAIMISDAFFPKRDGADVGLREGVSAIIQPGGSNGDYETVVACNEKNATMVYTGQRSFKH